MRELLFTLLGAAAASGLLCASALIARASLVKRPGAIPGRDIRLPEEETAEERRMREWLLLLGYPGEKGGAR